MPLKVKSRIIFWSSVVIITGLLAVIITFCAISKKKEDTSPEVIRPLERYIEQDKKDQDPIG